MAERATERRVRVSRPTRGQRVSVVPLTVWDVVCREACSLAALTHSPAVHGDDESGACLTQADLTDTVVARRCTATASRCQAHCARACRAAVHKLRNARSGAQPCLRHGVVSRATADVRNRPNERDVVCERSVAPLRAHSPFAAAAGGTSDGG